MKTVLAVVGVSHTAGISFVFTCVFLFLWKIYLVVLGISHAACISSGSCKSGQQMHPPNSLTHGWLLESAEKSFCGLCICICICICIYKYFDTVTMLIRQKGPLGISLIIREDFNVYVDFGFKPDPWIYQIVSNVILFLLFLILFFGCVLFLVVIRGCVLFFGPNNPHFSRFAGRHAKINTWSLGTSYLGWCLFYESPSAAPALLCLFCLILGPNDSPSACLHVEINTWSLGTSYLGLCLPLW